MLPIRSLWVATESSVFVARTVHSADYDGTKVVSICCTADERVLAATMGTGCSLRTMNKPSSPPLRPANDCVKAVAWDEHIGIVAATDAGITIIARW